MDKRKVSEGGLVLNSIGIVMANALVVWRDSRHSLSIFKVQCTQTLLLCAI